MRRPLRIGIVALALLLAPIVALSFFLDSAVSRAATYALGVDTSLDLVLRPISGRVSVLRLYVANPPGFETTHFLALNRGRFDLHLGSLNEETIVSPLLRLEGVTLSLERRGGRYNYQAILENLKRFESGDDPESGDAAGEGSGTQFVIRQLEILDVVADVDVSESLGDGGRLHVEVAEIRVANVGGERGVSMSELSGIVVKAILGGVAKHSVGLPPELSRALHGDLRGLGHVAIVVSGHVGSGAAAVAGAAAAGTIDDKVVEQTGKALRGLGGMLRGGEDE
ncbi:MAG: hypothetical protein V3U03_09670 [Myxococcota bacterium]